MKFKIKLRGLQFMNGREKSDLTVDFIAETDSGKAALEYFIANPNGDLRRLGNGHYFRLYEMESMSDSVTKITGAMFKKAKKGVNKGKLCIKIPRTDRWVHIRKLGLRKTA